jgi:pilus assembly protein HofM
MAFKTWQTGVHIQQDRVLIVALAREKSAGVTPLVGIPLAKASFVTAKFASQNSWLMRCATGERRCRIITGSSLFPGTRSAKVASPPGRCAARQRAALMAGRALARELEMSADTLCFDYAQDTFSNTFHVTAAQNNEVETLLALAKTLRLRLVTITPDASALANLLPAVAPAQCVAWRDRAAVAVGDAPPVGTPLNHRSRKRG